VSEISRADAKEYTETLGTHLGASWRQIHLGQRMGVPSALGLTTREWVENHLGGYVRLAVSDRKEAVAALMSDDATIREIADVVGVGKSTVARDLELVPNGTEQDDDQGYGPEIPVPHGTSRGECSHSCEKHCP